jgi:spore coat protein U-like protein
MKNSIRYSVLALATAALAFSTGAFASTTAGADLSVTANVVSECTISASGTVAFGAYGPLTNVSTGKNGTGSVSYTCSANTTSAYITLGQGANAVAGITPSTDAIPQRQMIHGSDLLAYSLWTDSGYSLVWGNTDTTGVAAVTFNGLPHSVTVYGTVTAGQNVPAASYSDTVVATVTYL